MNEMDSDSFEEDWWDAIEGKDGALIKFFIEQGESLHQRQEDSFPRFTTLQVFALHENSREDLQFLLDLDIDVSQTDLDLEENCLFEFFSDLVPTLIFAGADTHLQVPEVGSIVHCFAGHPSHFPNLQLVSFMGFDLDPPSHFGVTTYLH
jgi:hypothetical protein